MQTGSLPAEIAVVRSMICITADDGVNDRELWKSSVTAAGAVLAKKIAVGATSSSPDQFLKTTAAGSSQAVRIDLMTKSDL